VAEAVVTCKLRALSTEAAFVFRTKGALPQPEEHVLTAKRWTMSSRGRKPTVGVPLMLPNPGRGCPWQSGPSRAGCRLIPSYPWVPPTATQGAPLGGSKTRHGKLDSFASSFALRGLYAFSETALGKSC
jgi:hypothetical protein